MGADADLAVVDPDADSHSRPWPAVKVPADVVVNLDPMSLSALLVVVAAPPSVRPNVAKAMCQLPPDR